MNSPDPVSAAESAGAGTTPPDELPPVQPPSAGFIMQLFLVPGLIVAAVIGVWALFGRVAKSEQDWRQLVAELRSTNEHRRWRGATGLAQLLRADVELGEQGQQLSRNPQIAAELTALLTELLNTPLKDQELISQQQFVVLTMAWLDSPDVVMPALLEASDARHDLLVRTDALSAIAQIASRAGDRNEPLTQPGHADRLIELSDDPEPRIRQVAAYTLGLIPGEPVDQRLRMMTEDADPGTRINAAIALARRHLPDGYPVFEDVLTSAGEPVRPESMPGRTVEERFQQARNQDSMNLIILNNVLKALRDIRNGLSDSQRRQAIRLCEKIAADSPEIRIRMEAATTVRNLHDRQ